MAVRHLGFPFPLFFLCVFFCLAAQLPDGSTSAKVAQHQSHSLRPNIILITLDTTRADRMGFLGSTRGLTPNLDEMAKQGVAFSRAYSHVPLTTASHTTILTGTYPQFNHVNDFGIPLSPRLPYLPDFLHQHGYQTGAFVGSLILDPLDGTAPGFDRGFDVYDAGFHLRRHGADRYKTVERRAGDGTIRPNRSERAMPRSSTMARLRMQIPPLASCWKHCAGMAFMMRR